MAAVTPKDSVLVYPPPQVSGSHPHDSTKAQRWGIRNPGQAHPCGQFGNTDECCLGGLVLAPLGVSENPSIHMGTDITPQKTQVDQLFVPQESRVRMREPE